MLSSYKCEGKVEETNIYTVRRESCVVYRQDNQNATHKTQTPPKNSKVEVFACSGSRSSSSLKRAEHLEEQGGAAEAGAGPEGRIRLVTAGNGIPTFYEFDSTLHSAGWVVSRLQKFGGKKVYLSCVSRASVSSDFCPLAFSMFFLIYFAFAFKNSRVTHEQLHVFFMSRMNFDVAFSVYSKKKKTVKSTT